MSFLYKLTLSTLVLLVFSLMEASSQTYDARIAVILPFKAKLSEGSKSLEFYRGMLMAADEMKRQGYNVLIAAYDEQEPSADLTSTFHKAFANADLTVGCFYRSHVIAASRVAAITGKKAIFPFATYIPQEIVDCNSAIFTIPSPAIFTQRYAELLISTVGKSSLLYVKSPHPQTASETEDLLVALRKKGCKLSTLNTCESDEIAARLTSKRHNLIITDSNERDFVEHLLSEVDTANASERYEVSVAGTSSWMIMADALYRMRTKYSLLIPSTWYQSNNNPNISAKFSSYSHYFQTAPSEHKASPFLAGYELGLYAIANLKADPTNFPTCTVETPQFLSHFHFVNSYDAGCYTNAGLRLIKRATDGSISQIELQ